MEEERWDPDLPYGIIAKGCHMWPVRGHAYVVLVMFIPLHGWLLIRISTTLSDMCDSLFTPPLVEMHVYSYDDELRWLINSDDYDYIMMYLLYSYACFLECSSFRLHLYSCIIYMVKMLK
jgi:hypothetical protein